MESILMSKNLETKMSKISLNASNEEVFNFLHDLTDEYFNGDKMKEIEELEKKTGKKNRGLDVDGITYKCAVTIMDEEGCDIKDYVEMSFLEESMTNKNEYDNLGIFTRKYNCF